DRRGGLYAPDPACPRAGLGAYAGEVRGRGENPTSPRLDLGDAEGEVETRNAARLTGLSGLHRKFPGSPQRPSESAQCAPTGRNREATRGGPRPPSTSASGGAYPE